MKRLFVAVVLIAGISAAVYAQELKFDGYVNSGMGLVTSDQDGVDPALKVFGVDSEQNGYRFRLNGSYTNEAKNAGARFRFQSQANISTMGSINFDNSSAGTPASAGYFSLPYAFGWVSFLNNIITLNGGIVEDGTWSTGDWWLASDSVSQFTGLGALLKVTPIDGLALGFGAYTISRRGGSNNNTLAKDVLGSAADLEDAKYTLHGAYTMKDTFRVGISYRTENKSGADESSKLFGEFRFLGVKDLTAVIAVSADNLGDNFDTTGNIILSETFGYKIDSLGLGLNAVQFLYNRSEQFNPGLLFNVWGSYTIDRVVPRLDLVYFSGGQSNTAGSANTWHRKGFTNVARAADLEQDLSVFSARPSVKINLDGRTFLEIGDIINYDFGNYDSAYGGDESRLTNVLYVDIKLSF